MNQNAKDMNAILLDAETINQLNEIKQSTDPRDIEWIGSLREYGITGWENNKLLFENEQSKRTWISKGYEIL